MNRQHYVYPFTTQKTFGLFLPFDYYEQCCYEHAYRSFGISTCFQFFRYIPGSRIAGSYGSSMFNFWRTYQTVFYRSYIVLCSHQQWMRVLASPHSCQFLFHPPPFFLNIFISGMNLYLIAILICISLVPNDEHLFLYFLAIHTSSLEKCLYSKSLSVFMLIRVLYLFWIPESYQICDL